MPGQKAKQPKTKSSKKKKAARKSNSNGKSGQRRRKTATESDGAQQIKTKLIAIADQLERALCSEPVLPLTSATVDYQIRAIYFDIGKTLLVPQASGAFVWATGALAAIRFLSDKGVPLGVISNTPAMSRSQLQALLPDGFFDWFEEERIILSSEFGSDKRNLRIFYHALEQARIPSAQCLFVGEDGSETLNAQKTGMISLRITDYDADFALLRAIV
jgi:hypothetical protein